ncbi:hypothetical protein GE061_019202 [Apolygus lucorum]|uniref:Uncharacterized protein n=1 Tax=Apolygus lucorum TaxID=248454 RepID=A0A6A4JJH3_APOLU|nr:hypothetical protein GE061_019202 [Apolygus lucorum]
MSYGAEAFCTPPNAPRPLPPWVTDRKRAHMYDTPRPMPRTVAQTFDFGDEEGPMALENWDFGRSWSGSEMSDYLEMDRYRGAGGCVGTPSVHSSPNRSFEGNITPPYRPPGQDFYTSCHRLARQRGPPLYTPRRRVKAGYPYTCGGLRDEYMEQLRQPTPPRKPRNVRRYLSKRLGEGVSRIQQSFRGRPPADDEFDMDLDPNTRNLARNMDMIKRMTDPNTRRPGRYLSKRCARAGRALYNQPAVQYCRDKYEEGMGMAERAAFAFLSTNPRQDPEYC